jgi:hypothetical protein
VQAGKVGDMHSDIASTRYNLGILLEASWRPEEAECQLRSSLAARAKVFGIRSNEALDTARHLANVLDKLDAPEQAAAVRAEYALPVLAGAQ